MNRLVVSWTDESGVHTHPVTSLPELSYCEAGGHDTPDVYRVEHATLGSAGEPTCLPCLLDGPYPVRVSWDPEGVLAARRAMGSPYDAVVVGPPYEPGAVCDLCPRPAVAEACDEGGGVNPWLRCLAHLVEDFEAPGVTYAD